MSETTVQAKPVRPHCGAGFEVPPNAAGGEFPCPACHQLLRVPEENVPPQPAAPGPTGSPLCAICQSPILETDSKTRCPACQAQYHADCWRENRGCAIYGCSEVPKTEGRAGIEIPVGYWGQENKPCPACNQMILAAAVRCRHCGSVFQTARPLESAEFSRSVAWAARAPGLRKKTILFTVLALIPFTAPVGTLLVFFWGQTHRAEIEELPALYSALVKIGVLVGLLETVGLVLLAMAYALWHR